MRFSVYFTIVEIFGDLTPVLGDGPFALAQTAYTGDVGHPRRSMLTAPTPICIDHAG